MHAVLTFHPIDVFLGPLLAVPSRMATIRPLTSREPPSDVELVGRMMRGDRWAEEVLYRKYVVYLTNVIKRLLRNSHEAEDVVQEAFVIAFQRIATLREADAFKGWIAQIAVRLARRRYKKSQFLKALGLDRSVDDSMLNQIAAPHVSGEVRAELAALDQVLASLPSDHRIAWMLRHVEGEPLETVAEMCGCSLATVKRWIAAASEVIGRYVVVGEGDAL